MVFIPCLKPSCGWLPIACRIKSNPIKTWEVLCPLAPAYHLTSSHITLFTSTADTGDSFLCFLQFQVLSHLQAFVLAVVLPRIFLHASLHEAPFSLYPQRNLPDPRTIQPPPHSLLPSSHTTCTEMIMVISGLTCWPSVSPNLDVSSMTSGTCLIFYWVPGI